MTLNLKAEIIRLKTELEDRCLVIAEAKPFMDAVKSLHNGYSNPEMFKEPKNPRAAIKQLIGEAESLGLAESKLWKHELAELRSKVAWYFECIDTRKVFNPYIKQPGQNLKAQIIKQQARTPFIEMKLSLQEAEQSLRAGGNDA